MKAPPKITDQKRQILKLVDFIGKFKKINKRKHLFTTLMSMGYLIPIKDLKQVNRSQIKESRRNQPGYMSMKLL